MGFGRKFDGERKADRYRDRETVTESPFKHNQETLSPKKKVPK